MFHRLLRLCRMLRSTTLLTLGASTLLGACGLFRSPPPAPAPDPYPPIVFVHGNGDTAALWTAVLWRFESNGWPHGRLHAVDLPYPLARDDDAQPQEGRSSIAEYTQFLAAEIDKVLLATGARKVVLIGNSRGGFAIRSYIAHTGAAKVSHAILGGVPNHGVWADALRNPGNEFNGEGPFLKGLNAPKGDTGLEVTPGVKWMTIRSDNNDKFAQPDGAWIGSPGVPTQVGFDGPALNGAENVVLAGADHRETSFSRQAFAAAYRFITGREPVTRNIVQESSSVLDGKVSGLGWNNEPARGGYANNIPLALATVEVYAVDPATGERQGAAVHRKVTGTDGRWGPLRAGPQAHYEFVLSAPGYATTHIYRSPFPRSSDIVNMHPERIADADRDARSVVTLTRPRGYFGEPRDEISLDGKSPPAGIPAGVPDVSTTKLKVLDAAQRAVMGEFNGERIIGRAWPAAGNHVVFLELTY